MAAAWTEVNRISMVRALRTCITNHLSRLAAAIYWHGVGDVDEKVFEHGQQFNEIYNKTGSVIKSLELGVVNSAINQYYDICGKQLGWTHAILLVLYIIHL